MKPIFFNYAIENDEYDARNRVYVANYTKGKQFAVFINRDQTIIVTPAEKTDQACRVRFGGADGAFLVYGRLSEILGHISEHMGW